jgi:hypothetical protein
MNTKLKLELNNLVTQLILDARRGEVGLTNKYLPMFRDLVELAELDTKKLYIEVMQAQLERVEEILNKA